MPRRQDHFLLRGGLDLVTSALAIENGRLISVKNYESVESGYGRIAGYERFDGRPAPSAATYGILRFDGAASVAARGETVTGASSGSTGIMLADPVMESGSTDDNDAAGFYVLVETTGTFENNEELRVGAAAKGMAVDTLQPNGATDLANHEAYTAAAAELRRTAIRPVPGSGLVRGVWAFGGEIYAFRDNAAGTAGVMHQATASGWEAVDLGHALRFDEGTAEPDVGDRITAGATAAITYPTSERFSRGGTVAAASQDGRNALNARCIPANAQAYSAENPITTNIGNLPVADEYLIRQRYLLRLSKKWNRMTLDPVSIIDDGALFFIFGSDRFGTLDGSRYIAGVGQPSYTGATSDVTATVDPDAPGWGEADANGHYWVVLEFYFIEQTGGQACNVRLGWRNADNTEQAAAEVNANGGIATRQAVAMANAEATLAAYSLAGGTWSGGDASGVLYLNVERGAFPDNAVLRRGGVGSETAFARADGATTAQTLPAGGRYEFRNHNFFGQARSRKMYGVNGVGPAFEWDGSGFRSILTGRDAADETPNHLAIQSNHLLLSYPGGSIQNSATGDPLDWTAGNGAAEIATGQEINGMVEGAGLGNTTILGANVIQVLYGQDKESWELRTHSGEESGAIEWTGQLMGSPVYLDNRGLRALETTDRYGNFTIGTLTFLVQPWIEARRAEGNVPTASMRMRSKDLYRLFFGTKAALSVYFGRENPECSIVELNHVVRCVCTFEGENGVERVMFGSDDGLVFEAEKGRNFDGSKIEAFARVPYNHLGSPSHAVRLFKVDVHAEVQARASLRVGASFDYGDNDDSFLGEPTALYGGGAIWGETEWGDFYYGAPLATIGEFRFSGVGPNVSLLVRSVTAEEQPHVLNGVTIHYANRRLRR